ncbi:MAG: nucleotidyltransferase domain-containing protein [Bacteroidetes bacterium]|nr:MAG: nucleotidyltransferase domain-containing protein [Bacteroidota bacterium]
MAENSIITESVNFLKSLLFEKEVPYEKIILFGSYANGKSNEDSDIDFIVVSSVFRNKDYFEKFDLTKNIKSQLVKKFDKPYDILYYSDIDWETSRAVPINEAKKYGLIVYSVN